MVDWFTESGERRDYFWYHVPGWHRLSDEEKAQARGRATRIPAGERAPDGHTYSSTDTWWYFRGMPTGITLRAWTIEVAADLLEVWHQRHAATVARLRAVLG
jgi:hypothetical protein